MNNRLISLWAYKNGDSKSDLFYDMDMATDMIAQKCGIDIKLLIIKKNELSSITHSVLNKKIVNEVKVQNVNPTNIIGIHDIDYNNRRHRIDIDGVRSRFSSKRLLTRIYKKYKQLSTGFEDFLQKFYFHFTCSSRIQSIKLHGLVSSSEPTIDINGGRCAKRKKTHNKKRNLKKTHNKKRNLKKTQKKKTSRLKKIFSL